MALLFVQLHVTREVAIRQGSTRFGAQSIALSDTDLANLTQGEREELAACSMTSDMKIDVSEIHVDRIRWIYSDDVSINALKIALAERKRIREEYAQHLQEEEEKNRQIEAQIIEYVINASVGSLLTDVVLWEGNVRYDGFGVREHTSDHYKKIPWDHPRLQVKLEECIRDANKRNTEILAKKIAHLEILETARNAAIAEFTKFALDGRAGTVAQRAAQKGYDVVTHVVESVMDFLPSPGVDPRDTENYTWDERNSPSMEALDLHDRLVEAIKVVDKPTSVTIEVSRVMRLTLELDGEEENYTGCVITISSPLTADRYLIYFSE